MSVGIAAEPDVIRAESGLADTVESIIVAENDVRQAQRNLKRILNDLSLPLDAPTTVVPTTPPAAFPYDLEPTHLTDKALNQRMEMLDLELQIAEQTSNVTVARNGMLPLVTLQYSYGVTGLGKTYGQAWEMAWEHTPDSHRLGLHLEVPIGNEAARSEYSQRDPCLNADPGHARTGSAPDPTGNRQRRGHASDRLAADHRRSRTREALIPHTGHRIRQFNLQIRTTTDVLIAESESDPRHACLKFRPSATTRSHKWISRLQPEPCSGHPTWIGSPSQNRGCPGIDATFDSNAVATRACDPVIR